MSNPFVKATKHDSKIRMAITGPSGSGKTYSALRIATALAKGGKIALVDTEHGAASKYADDPFTFDAANLEPPFHPERYIELIRFAEENEYKVLIIDSLSHAWQGTGGALDLAQDFSKKYRGNTYSAWADVTPIQNALIDAILRSDLHVIVTMRSKEDYILTEQNGKQVPKKVGMAPIQRDSMPYEFDLVLDMDIENAGVVSKTRCPALPMGSVHRLPGEDVATILVDWLAGEPLPAPEEAMREAQTLDAWSLAAYRFPDVKKYLETPERLRAWFSYVLNDFDSDTAEQSVALLSNFIRYRKEGLKASDAVTAALAVAGVQGDQEETKQETKQETKTRKRSRANAQS